MRADLAKLIDSVSRRTRRIELDTTIELSAMARCVVTSDVLGDKATSMTRYSAVPSEALEGACLDLATWVNAQSHRTGDRIETYVATIVPDHVGVLGHLLDMLDKHRGQLNDGERHLLAMSRNHHARWSGQ